jgi:NTE family protein
MPCAIARAAATLVCALLLSACASFPPNPPLAKYDPSAGYRFELLDQGGNSDGLFAILAFSGGGTRAAALSYGVLEALRDTRIQLNGKERSLLDEVDVISAISGGSFTAAYYALHGARTFDEFPQRFLYRPVETELIRSALNPASWFRLAGSGFGRSDLAAEFYEREVFGAKTYADLVARRRRPFVILNATDMTLGAQFSFVQDQFDLLCSDLSGVSLGRAVAASSAFPGLLTPLTFSNYAGSCDYRQPRWVESAAKDRKSRVNAGRTASAERRLSYAASGEARRDYIHLIDGGVADNLGLREPLASVANLNHPWSVLRLINLEQVNKLVVIVVNAATDPATDRDKTPKVPGLIDTVTAAATVPLNNYSTDTLDLLRRTVNEFNESARLVSGCKDLAAARGAQCALDIAAPRQIELFPIEVAFEYIDDAEERAWFKNLPTTLQLPRESVDKLRAVGRRILEEDPNFRKLVQTLR